MEHTSIQSMIDPKVLEIVSAIHAQPHRVVFEFAGAGSLALFWLHSIGGSSRTMLEATDHYAASSTVGILGYEPHQFVTPKTVRALARRAYQRGLCLSAGNAPVIGIGCTATIATDYTKRGKHHCQVALCQRRSLVRYEVTFVKGRRERLEEETLVSRFILNGLVNACGLSASLELGLDHTEQLQTFSEEPRDPLDQLLTGTVNTVTINPDGTMVADESLAGIGVLSGSFHPMHDGHLRLLDVAAETLQRPVIFELSVANAEKNKISYLQVSRRISQFTGRHKIVVTRRPLFHQKSGLFPNSVFVIGFDTAERLIDNRYYGGDESQMLAALAKIRDADCSFLVAGRLWQDKFRGLRDLTIPTGYEDLFQSLSEDRFRMDVASTTLR